MKHEDKLFCKYLNTGDNKSLEELFNVINDWLLPVISIKVNDKEAAKDILQDTWVKVLEKKDFKFNQNKRSKHAAISNYILTIALNEVKEKAKKDKIFLQKITEISNNHLNNITLRTQDEIIEEIERTENIQSEIKKLPKNEREVIELRYRVIPNCYTSVDVLKREVNILEFDDELKVKEIAKKINKPVGTIKVLLFRGRNKLKKKLYKYLK